MRSPLGVAVFLLLLSTQNARAMFVRRMDEDVPVSRLIENTTKYIKSHPKEAQGYYTLARVHSLAFSRYSTTSAPQEITVVRGTTGRVEKQVVGSPQRALKVIREDQERYGPRGLPELVDESDFPTRESKKSPDTEDLQHLTASVRNFMRATELSPQNGSYWLGLGWMLEQGAPLATRIGTPWNLKNPARRSTFEQWVQRSLSAYRRVYSMKKNDDAFGDIRIEAGESILRLHKLPNRVLSSKEKREKKQVNDRVAALKRQPFAVTPIILPLGHSMNFRSLVSPSSQVTFDLAGDGLRRRWPWVSADTGILVWDPENTGKISSGRQLFGSVTWWVFWKNGYEALAALDDNVDGELRGEELEGISIWRDTNGDGVSDLGEVKPIGEWGFSALAVNPTGTVKGMPANLRGAMKSDGTAVPTYDWIPKSLN